MTNDKKCHACGVVKPTTDFYKSSSSKDGFAPSCKDCQNGKTTVVKKPKVETPKPKETKPKIVEKPPKPSKDELIAKLEWEKAKKLTADEPPKAPEPLGEDLHSKNAAWWYDPDRKFGKGTPGPSLPNCPRAVTIISIHGDSAVIEYYQDPTCERKEVRSTVPTNQLKRRHF